VTLFKIKKLNEEGQSTIEFALTLILVMAFMLFYFQLGLLMGLGNYIHYATFMSARAYLSAGSSPDDQVSRATYVLNAMLAKPNSTADRFPSIARGQPIDGCQNPVAPGGCVGLGDNGYKGDGDRDLSWMQGVRYRFRGRLFILPLAGLSAQSQQGFTTDVNSLTLTSESWLGREPTYSECSDDMGKLKGIYDNGC
jgi:hypothetical protein